jgi:hypothetical protein
MGRPRTSRRRFHLIGISIAQFVAAGVPRDRAVLLKSGCHKLARLVARGDISEGCAFREIESVATSLANVRR